MTIKLKNLTEQQTKDLLPDGKMILLGYRGSVAHDMFRPSNSPNSIDDIDIMGVYVNPIEHYLGFGRKETHERFIGEWDAVSYELRKFIGLLNKNNPNVMSMLWLDSKHVIYQSPVGERLVENRDLFCSKQAYHSFIGYAHGQFKRMTHLNEEALEKINTRRTELETLGVEFADKGILLPSHADTVLKEKVRQYEELRSKYFSGYMGDKRKNLVEKHGFDTKNASHLIRLLRMGIEYLGDGKLRVQRKDKQELLDIKDGKWSLEKVQEEAEKLFDLSREAYVHSPLPAECDMVKTEELCVSLVKEALL